HLVGLELDGIRLMHLPPQLFVALEAGGEPGLGEAVGHGGEGCPTPPPKLGRESSPPLPPLRERGSTTKFFADALMRQEAVQTNGLLPHQRVREELRRAHTFP